MLSGNSINNVYGLYDNSSSFEFIDDEYYYMHYMKYDLLESFN